MEKLDPISRIEFFLDAVLNGDPAPYDPQTRSEFYLAYLCGSAVTLPTPQSRVDFYLAYKCGEDVEIHDPIERIDFYLAKWCGYDCETPDPIHPIEYYLNALANSGGLKTVTGNPISVSDALAKPAESLVIEILPQQSGSGDPSPDNVRPISGHDSVKVTRTGKNLIPPLDAQNAVKYNGSGLSVSNVTDGIAVTGQEGGSSHAVGFIVLDANDFLGEQLTLSCDISADNSQPQIMLVTCDASYGSRSILAYGTTSGAITATIPQTAAGKKIGISLFSTTGADSATCVSRYTNIQLELGSATAYEPYQGDTDTIQLGQTVYSGTLDVTTGVLTKAPYYDPYNGEPLVGPWVSSMDKYVPGATPTTGAQVVDLGGTGTDVQLPATEVQMLLGNNVIWNDVGDMVLEYLADGPADDIDALNILLNNRYVNNGAEDEATDKEALEILLGGNTR